MSKKWPPGLLSISTPKLAHCAVGKSIILRKQKTLDEWKCSIPKIHIFIYAMHFKFFNWDFGPRLDNNGGGE